VSVLYPRLAQILLQRRGKSMFGFDPAAGPDRSVVAIVKPGLNGLRPTVIIVDEFQDACGKCGQLLCDCRDADWLTAPTKPVGMEPQATSARARRLRRRRTA
jgi:hypothetical protein